MTMRGTMSPQERRRTTRANGSIPSASDGGTTAVVRRGLAFVLAALTWSAALAPIEAQQQSGRIGGRVVQKVADLTLRINDEPVTSERRAMWIYRIEETDGKSLLLKSESDRTSGWASALDVIAVDRAVEYFSQMIKLQTHDPFPFAMLGLLRQDRKEHDLAIANYNEVIRLDPQSAAGFAGRATAWYSKGELDKAIADFDVSLRLDAKNAVGLLGRGLTRVARKQYVLGIADFSEAIWIDPLSISGYDYRGRAWQSKNEYAKAIIDFNMALRLDPEQAAVYRRRGSCWEAEKRYGKAIADFNEAIRIDPGDAPAHRELARLLATCPDRELRDAKLAIVSANKACELTQWKGAAELDTLAAAYAAAGDFESAVKWQIKSNALSRSPLEQKEAEARLKQYREKTP
jgi:tetratricopeptide (TPR) repeat protein